MVFPRFRELHSESTERLSDNRLFLREELYPVEHPFDIALNESRN